MNDLILEMNLRLKTKEQELLEVLNQIKMLEEYNRQKKENNERRGSDWTGRSRPSQSYQVNENYEDSYDEMQEARRPTARRNTNNANHNPLQLRTPTRDELMLNNLTRMILGRR